jgi:predicted exporter
MNIKSAANSSLPSIASTVFTIAMKKLLSPAIGCWIIFSLLCAFIVSQAQFTTDMSAFLPRNPSPRQQILIEQISEGFASRVLVVAVEGVTPPVLAQISTAMGQKLRESKVFLSVNNGQTSADNRDQAVLFENRYQLSPAMDANRMSVEGLRAAVIETLAEVSSSTGLFSKALLGNDPTGESLEVIKNVIPTSQPTQAEGVWMNASQTRALMLLQTQAEGSDLDAQEAAHAAISTSFNQARSLVGQTASQATMKFSGPGVFAVNARDTIKSEAARLSMLGTIMVLGLLWLIYRSVTTLLLGMIPVVTGAIAGIAAVQIGFSSIHGMTLGFGITLIGEAVDYAIYLFVQYTPRSAEKGDTDSNSTPAPTFWPTIRLGVLTSIFGFSTLLFSGFTGLAQLGLFSIAGIVVAATVTRYVLPVLLPIHFSVRQPAKLGALLARLTQRLSSFKIATNTVIAAALLVLGLNWNTVWSVELGGLSPVSEAAQKLDAELRGDMGAPDTSMLIVLKAPSSELALQQSELVSMRLKALVDAGVLAGFQAPTNYLPSQRTQMARIANVPDEAELRVRMSQALQTLPLKPDKVEAFFADAAKAKTSKPLTRDGLEQTSLSLGVDSLLTQSTKTPHQWTALIALQPPVVQGSPQKISAKTINDALSGAALGADHTLHVIELKTEAANLYTAYLNEAIFLTAAGFACILVLLFASLRSAARVVRVVMPLLASVAIVAAGLVLVKGSLSLLHLVGLLLVIAIGSNYALFFDQRSRMGLPQASTFSDHNMLCSLFFANLTTVLGFGLLAFSSVPVMNAIGLTVGTGTFLALVLSAVFAAPPEPGRQHAGLTHE